MQSQQQTTTRPPAWGRTHPSVAATPAAPVAPSQPVNAPTGPTSVPTPAPEATLSPAPAMSTPAASAATTTSQPSAAATQGATDSAAAANAAAAAAAAIGGEFDQNANYTSASLYIGDLSEDVTEPMLYEIFSQPASVASIRICRDSQTNRSLGYGYVNYHTVQDAEHAMDLLNFTLIGNLPCRIMWANRDKASRTKSENNVFVKNLDRNIDNKALYDTFSLFGTIVSCKVATDSAGRSLGYGYVLYEKEQSLVDAIKRVNGMQIGNSTVFCGRHIRKEDRQSLRDERYTNLYVKGHEPGVTDSDKLLAEFKSIGKITSTMTKKDEKGREALFINFEDFNKAKEAVAQLNGRRFNDEGILLSREETERLDADDAANLEANPVPEPEDDDEELPQPARLYVNRHQSRAERDEHLKSSFQSKSPPREPQTNVLYTRHFPVSFSDEDLSALFETFGLVTSASAARDEQGVSRGFGFVTMPESQDAQKAITGLHDTTITQHLPHIENTTGAKLYVAYLEPKEVRQARLKAQIADNVWRPGYNAHYGARPMPGAGGAPGAPTAYNSVVQGHRPMVGGYPVRRGGAPAPRPAPRPSQSGARGPGGQPGFPAVGGEQFAERITEMNFKDQKQAIGDRLYHVIMSRQPSLAGKITGMMLEMPNEDLLDLLTRPDELTVKIDEAIEVLKAAGGNSM